MPALAGERKESFDNAVQRFEIAQPLGNYYIACVYNFLCFPADFFKIGAGYGRAVVYNPCVIFKPDLSCVRFRYVVYYRLTADDGSYADLRVQLLYYSYKNFIENYFPAVIVQKAQCFRSFKPFFNCERTALSISAFFEVSST